MVIYFVLPLINQFSVHFDREWETSQIFHDRKSYFDFESIEEVKRD